MTRHLCAICDNTNETTRLCPKCRADPANEGWSEEWEDIEFTGDVEAASVSPRNRGAWQPSAPRTLADVCTEPSLEERILGLLLDQAQADSRRRRRLTHAGIAEKLGCTRQAVSQILGQISDPRREKRGNGRETT